MPRLSRWIIGGVFASFAALAVPGIAQQKDEPPFSGRRTFAMGGNSTTSSAARECPSSSSTFAEATTHTGAPSSLRSPRAIGQSRTVGGIISRIRTRSARGTPRPLTRTISPRSSRSSTSKGSCRRALVRRLYGAIPGGQTSGTRPFAGPGRGAGGLFAGPSGRRAGGEGQGDPGRPPQAAGQAGEGGVFRKATARRDCGPSWPTSWRTRKRGTKCRNPPARKPCATPASGTPSCPPASCSPTSIRSGP